MDVSIIANNIKKYRKYFHMSQLELAKKIGLSRSAIANYETGINLPDIDTLKLIANCFGISVENLYAQNQFDKDISIKKFFANKKDLLEFGITIMFPTVCNELALKDSLFKEAYNNHMRMLLSQNKITYKEVSNICNLYDKSFKKNHTIESVGNMLSILLLTFSFLSVDEKTIKISKEIFERGYMDSYIIKEYVVQPNAPEDKKAKERLEYYNENREFYLTLLRTLRKDIKLRDFADYYFALCYLIGFNDNLYDVKTNNLIFNELILNYAEIGNQYAINFISKCDDFFK